MIQPHKTTRQDCNLFQDLWNKLLVFSKSYKKLKKDAKSGHPKSGTKMTSKNVKKEDEPSVPPNPWSNMQ